MIKSRPSGERQKGPASMGPALVVSPYIAIVIGTAVARGVVPRSLRPHMLSGKRAQDRVMMKQRDMMRKLLLQHGYNEQAVCVAYAQAERAGLVDRKNNRTASTPTAMLQLCGVTATSPGSPGSSIFAAVMGLGFDVREPRGDKRPAE